MNRHGAGVSTALARFCRILLCSSNGSRDLVLDRGYGPQRPRPIIQTYEILSKFHVKMRGASLCNFYERTYLLLKNRCCQFLRRSRATCVVVHCCEDQRSASRRTRGLAPARISSKDRSIASFALSRASLFRPGNSPSHSKEISMFFQYVFVSYFEY
jgi:hypothetical protein